MVEDVFGASFVEISIFSASSRFWVIELDASLENFFRNFVVAYLRLLRQIVTEAERAIEQLTVKQVVLWFEKEGKIPTERGTEAAFLDL